MSRLEIVVSIHGFRYAIVTGMCALAVCLTSQKFH